ncbi:MAG: hypothetical protein OHK0013_48650 [Sandaracinaceae bacterium]
MSSLEVMGGRGPDGRRYVVAVCLLVTVAGCGASSSPLPDAGVADPPDAAVADDAWVCREAGEPCFSIGDCCSELCYLDTHTCLARP